MLQIKSDIKIFLFYSIGFFLRIRVKQFRNLKGKINNHKIDSHLLILRNLKNLYYFFPFNIPTNSKINIAPPTTHTQGCWYQVFPLFKLISTSNFLSCAQEIIVTNINDIASIPLLMKEFIKNSFCFLLK